MEGEEDISKIYDDATKQIVQQKSCCPFLSLEKNNTSGVDESILNNEPNEIEITVTHATVEDIYIMKKY